MDTFSIVWAPGAIFHSSGPFFLLSHRLRQGAPPRSSLQETASIHCQQPSVRSHGKLLRAVMWPQRLTKALPSFIASQARAILGTDQPPASPLESPSQAERGTCQNAEGFTKAEEPSRWSGVSWHVRIASSVSWSVPVCFFELAASWFA